MKIFCALSIILILFAGCENEPEIVRMESGVQFLDDTLGTGNEAKEGDLISIHFISWIIQDSTKIFEDWSKDSTKLLQTFGDSRKFKPVKFVLGEESFIKGCERAIVGMKAGGSRTIIIPSHQAYGERGYGPIPPNANLKVVVKLLYAKKVVEVKKWEIDSSKIVTTKSGLKYVIIKEGIGAIPDSGDVVAVHYTGWFENGMKFESSVEKDEPFRFQFKVRPVIPGWEEALKILKEGSKAQLIIPPSLAYGNRIFSKIPPNSTLIFDVELIEVN
jgi:peptidylprolyl isomerase